MQGTGKALWRGVQRKLPMASRMAGSSHLEQRNLRSAMGCAVQGRWEEREWSTMLYHLPRSSTSTWPRMIQVIHNLRSDKAVCQISLGLQIMKCFVSITQIHAFASVQCSSATHMLSPTWQSATVSTRVGVGGQCALCIGGSDQLAL